MKKFAKAIWNGTLCTKHTLRVIFRFPNWLCWVIGVSQIPVNVLALMVWFVGIAIEYRSIRTAVEMWNDVIGLATSVGGE